MCDVVTVFDQAIFALLIGPLQLPSRLRDYIMSASPPKEPDVEQNANSGVEQDHMDRDQEGTQGTGLDFEVKEQDRWLPIANGWCTFHFCPYVYYSPCWCHRTRRLDHGLLICSALALPAMQHCARLERCISPLCESECATLQLLFSQHLLIRRGFSSFPVMVWFAAFLYADWCGISTTQRALSTSASTTHLSQYAFCQARA